MVVIVSVFWGVVCLSSVFALWANEDEEVTDSGVVRTNEGGVQW